MRSGVDYRENDVDDDRNAAGSSRPADSGYRGIASYKEEDEAKKDRGRNDRDRVRFRNEVGEVSYRNRIVHDRRQPTSTFDDDEDQRPRRLNL